MYCARTERITAALSKLKGHTQDCSLDNNEKSVIDSQLKVSGFMTSLDKMEFVQFVLIMFHYQIALVDKRHSEISEE